MKIMKLFIIFIDIMYDSNVKLLLHSKTNIYNIFQPYNDNTANANTTIIHTVDNKDQDDILNSHDEVFAFNKQYVVYKKWSNYNKIK